MGRTVNIAEDIKAVLHFYQSLGFDRLPIKTVTSKELRVTSKKKNKSFEPRTPNSELSSSRVTRHASRDKEAALAALREEIGDCQRCKLSKGRKNIVFGEGNPGAVLMFIGEAPGREEDIQARPFVGDAGKLLTRLIEKMGFKREEVYIGNIVKCRPPQNREPEEDEIRTCLPFIQRQVEIISPKVIVSLGRISAQTLIGTKTPISRLRGGFYEYKGIPLMPTFHPAYLLRNPKDKWLVWEDAQRVMERLKDK
ncbi:MAG: uracil-DNA glycosylase [Nitrospirae bacterium]|nr:uracil-DNA glycosylase [Nitrospirota bacterium]MCL5420903.1 uracil-DNA glycosylase [Nitrospirota bacterium]